ncbi:Dihydroorotate dehydrogenase-domain-containing protein [Mycena maculata]|uniref:Dihydroorotate dehydrogenase (quinone), mitochondrial n=1 Tax=Mycena maculata TaxID=230809 RepID=A0AAD7HHD5_9AGAR|nr:Dihydroorotate dehydrogenase-domain-containing protein [Mycena maculata]
MLRRTQGVIRPAFARSLFTRTPVPRTPIRTGLYSTVFVLSAGLFAIYYLDARSAIHRYVFTPLLRHTLDAETGHKVAVQVLKSGLGPRDPVEDDARLKSELWGQEISNPVGLAAGFDKNGEAIDGLFNLGFSWVEIGSVTPKPQPGNPRPRVFHLPDDSAFINRYGFPSEGHASVLSRLRARIPRFFDDENGSAAFRPGAMLAVNLGKNKESSVESIDDFVAGVRTFGPHSDVLVVNVSSPNTPGLRGLQNRELLETLLSGVTQARDQLPSPRKPKLVLKIAPDLTETQLIEIAAVIENTSIDGVIVSNTTTQRPSDLVHPNKSETGGLSGAPLKQYSLAALRTLRKNLPARIPLIGCGGISTGADALEYAKSGATLVQVYTGFGYDGVGACRRIKDQLVDELEKEGLTWGDVVQKAVSELSLSPRARDIDEKLKADADPSLQQLIAEAEELKSLLDQFGEPPA